MGLLIALIIIQAYFARIKGGNIEILTEENVVECGKNVTLTCKIEESSLLVAWMFADDIVPIARCLIKTCDITKDYVGKYQLDYNTDEGLYNLTIMKLTIAEIGRTFVCTSGHESVSKTILLKDFRAFLFEDAENGIITASSGFISPDTKIVMKWTKIDADDSHESVFHPQLLYTTANMYSNVSLCSINQLMQHSVAISAEPSDKGKHYLKLAVTFENETIVSNITTLKYNVEEQGKVYCDYNHWKRSHDDKNDNSALYTVIMTILCVMLLIAFSISLVLNIKCRHNTSKLPTKKQDSDADVSCEEDSLYSYRRRSSGSQIHDTSELLTQKQDRDVDVSLEEDCIKDINDADKTFDLNPRK